MPIRILKILFTGPYSNLRQFCLQNINSSAVQNLQHCKKRIPQNSLHTSTCKIFFYVQMSLFEKYKFKNFHWLFILLYAYNRNCSCIRTTVCRKSSPRIFNWGVGKRFDLFPLKIESERNRKNASIISANQNWNYHASKALKKIIHQNKLSTELNGC